MLGLCFWQDWRMDSDVFEDPKRDGWRCLFSFLKRGYFCVWLVKLCECGGWWNDCGWAVFKVWHWGHGRCSSHKCAFENYTANVEITLRPLYYFKNLKGSQYALIHRNVFRYGKRCDLSRKCSDWLSYAKPTHMRLCHTLEHDYTDNFKSPLFYEFYENALK